MSLTIKDERQKKEEKNVPTFDDLGIGEIFCLDGEENTFMKISDTRGSKCVLYLSSSHYETGYCDGILGDQIVKRINATLIIHGEED